MDPSASESFQKGLQMPNVVPERGVKDSPRWAGAGGCTLNPSQPTHHPLPQNCFLPLEASLSQKEDPRQSSVLPSGGDPGHEILAEMLKQHGLRFPGYLSTPIPPGNCIRGCSRVTAGP